LFLLASTQVGSQIAAVDDGRNIDFAITADFENVDDYKVRNADDCTEA
jgi:hypothetical protein